LAVNSSYKAFTKKALVKRIKVMEKSVTRYLQELDAEDEQETIDDQQATSEATKENKAF
jgi:hypothetical protein